MPPHITSAVASAAKTPRTLISENIPYVSIVSNFTIDDAETTVKSYQKAKLLDVSPKPHRIVHT